jgi:hypothetical protein
MKPWYLSKTLWFNIILGIVGIVSLPTVIQLFSAKDLPYLMAISTVGNYILRTYFTSTAIGTPAV